MSLEIETRRLFQQHRRKPAQGGFRDTVLRALGSCECPLMNGVRAQRAPKAIRWDTWLVSVRRHRKLKALQFAKRKLDHYRCLGSAVQACRHNEAEEVVVSRVDSVVHVVVNVDQGRLIAWIDWLALN